LALLKVLGFTQRQLAAAVVWRATVAVIIGMIVGIPLGIGLMFVLSPLRVPNRCAFLLPQTSVLRMVFCRRRVPRSALENPAPGTSGLW
jgi:hypothetical protein